MTRAEDATTRDMEALLETERQCLLRGDFDALAALGSRKEALLEDLSRAPADPGLAARVLALATANRRLAAAASAGLRTAMRRLAELEQLDAGTGQYDRFGARSRLPGAGRTIRKV